MGVQARGTARDSWTQQGPKLTATDAAGKASFGISVALSADGNTALIGGNGDSGAVGAAWMFAVATWTQQGPKLTASRRERRGQFGDSVALSADGSDGADRRPRRQQRSVGAAWAFAAKNQAVYWDNPQAGSIGRRRGAPSQVDQDFTQGDGRRRTVWALAADSEHLYWTAGAFIARANLDGSDVERAVRRLGSVETRWRSMGNMFMERRAHRSAVPTSTEVVSRRSSSPWPARLSGHGHRQRLHLLEGWRQGSIGLRGARRERDR